MAPELAKTIAAIREHVERARKSGRSVGLVPTMGALHAGHAALMDCARRECGYVVATIFVNPIQFNHASDYHAYTIDLACDLDFCAAQSVDVVFAPDAAEMYPVPQSTFVEVTGVSDHLCGKFRPGHFRGVATVVAKLFHIVAADRAYFGEKDAQQLAVIQRMVADLNLPVAIIPVPTVREADGLALSSRNRRLSPEQRRIAPVVFRALDAARARIRAGTTDAGKVKDAALEILNAEPTVRLEYLEVVDDSGMQPVEEIRGPVRIAAAVWLGATRLIDNVFFTPSSH
jgi:pantoate--beta-alanine ligase